MNPQDEQPVTIETLAANRRHDAERHAVTMDPAATLRARAPRNLAGRRLTDKRIAHYQNLGFYSDAFHQARRALMQKKAAQRQARDGNFILAPDGRRIYSPL